MNYKKILTTVAVAAAGAALPAVADALSHLVPVFGPALAGVVLALAHLIDAPKKS